MKIQIPRKLEPFLTKKKRYKVAFGGRGGAKSMTIADILCLKGYLEDALIGCIREYQNSLEDSVLSLMSAEIDRIGIPGYKILKNRIDRVGRHAKGGMRFKGLSRSIEAVKSAHGYNYFWLEEGQFLSQDSLKTLTPTLREEGSELWISANPMSAMDAFSQRFIIPYRKQIDKYGFFEDDLHYIVKINYTDNPWFPDVLEQERRHDELYLPKALYDHIWLGEFNDSVQDSIIDAAWFDAAIDAHIKLGFKPRGVKILAFDPADTGDAKAYAIRHGSVILDVKSREYSDVNESCDWALDTAIEEKCDLFTWDGDGMGVALSKQIKDALENTKLDYQIFKGSMAPDFPDKLYSLTGYKFDQLRQKTNKEVFKNKRAQYWWTLRDRFFNTYRAVEKGVYTDPSKLISISSGISELAGLRSEICTVPRKYNGNGMIQILSKQEMKSRKIPSPNMGDSTMMSLLIPNIVEKSPNVEFDSLW